MKRLRALLIFISLTNALGCADDEPTPGIATLRLVRATDGFIDVEIAGAEQNPRALEIELEIESEDTMLVEDSRGAPALGTDTVRSASRGTNRAILFVGDKRGLLLPKSGTLARFKIVPSAGNSSAEAVVRISRARLVDSAAAPIEVELGAGITAR